MIDTAIHDFRKWLRDHRARGTIIMQEGADLTDAAVVPPWQDKMQAWCWSLISEIEPLDRGEAGRYEPLVKITHPNALPNPLSDEHQMFWRCHFERLLRLDDFLDRLNRRFGVASIESTPRLPKKQRGMAGQDAPLIEEMRRLIVSGEATGVPYAAYLMAPKAVGRKQTLVESKAKRLERRYMKKYG